ncbi:histidine kinase CKI1-like [Neltuma alba]|uniref:histidine kinase CKI1-like n=1 Tax=Neltuma alba TaxID=207710 RepID=UPI0010A3841A|nr:histidine kinase CKI1-like [Prosopis alba]
MKSASVNLARILSSTFNKTTNVSFSDVETKVAPVLFQAFKMIPQLSEISYIGMDGLFFSYYKEHDQNLAMYSNSSISSASGSSKITYYVQPVNLDTGGLYGEAVTYKHPVNTSWTQEAVNSSNGYASLGYKWSGNHQILYLNLVSISRTGVISLGLPASTITDFVTPTRRQGSSLYLASKDGKVLLQGIQHAHIVFYDDTASFYSVKPNGELLSNQGFVSCKAEATASVLKIGDTQYLTRCSSIDIMGVELAYVLAIPQNGLVTFVRESRKRGLVLMSTMIVMILASIFSFLLLNAIMGRREMRLCFSLIKQMEATQQAERKSMNKSLAFASAGHDIRAFLAGLTGLIEMSYEEVIPGSELEANLKQMGTCTEDLLGLLNSILDTSKIEAGKMQLDEEEFDLSQVIEEATDWYYPAAMKKGVDLVLDHCNGSVIRYSHVKGDKGKLKQVLYNLLNNAVKFTNEGHVVVRAWAQKPSFQKSIMASKRYNFIKHFPCLFYKKNESDVKVEVRNAIQREPNLLEFVFEVDDTGKGIPKEKHKSVFDDYVQVKENASGLGGTGLGLGIVQSLVRLMHGDIGIMEKEIGEKGSCFRFNVLLHVCETVTGGSNTKEDNDLGGDIHLNQFQGQDINTPSSGSSICSPSPKLPIFASSRSGASCIILLIQNEERRRTTRRFMESLGIRVKVVRQWEHLSHTLKKIKEKGHNSNQSSIGTSDTSSRSASQNSNSRARGFPLSATDGIYYMPSIFNRLEDRASSGLVLLVIDSIAGPFSELSRIVFAFKRDLGSPCKVVWLNKPLCGDSFKALGEDALDPDDIILSKPFQGSRLFEIMRLLPEFGGSSTNISRIGRVREDTFHNRLRKSFKDCHTSRYQSPISDRAEFSSSSVNPSQDYGNSSRRDQLYSSSKFKARNSPIDHKEIQKCNYSNNDKPLCGKKFLIADDVEYLRRIAFKTLIHLGASAANVKECENGKEAVNLVEESLKGAFPYDYIIMDCEMPVMDGFEATKQIRKMEKGYGVHVPILALTAHTSGEEISVTKDAGMDAHLGKPLRPHHLLAAIKDIHNNTG